jgi:hypothetical protein
MSWKQPVWNQVDKFRKEHACAEMSEVPIDTVFIADVVLRLNIIPFDDLRARYGIEAAISADFAGIYVDGEIYDVIDGGGGWKFNRLRFSIAHEIGHFYMHRGEFEAKGFRTAEEFLTWTNLHGHRKYEIEREANEFAGRLLVPPDRLETEFRRLETCLNGVLSHWRADESVRKDAAESIAQRFGVAPQVILTRFTRENLWPEP